MQSRNNTKHHLFSLFFPLYLIPSFTNYSNTINLRATLGQCLQTLHCTNAMSDFVQSVTESRATWRKLEFRTGELMRRHRRSVVLYCLIGLHRPHSGRKPTLMKTFVNVDTFNAPSDSTSPCKKKKKVVWKVTLCSARGRERGGGRGGVIRVQ